MSTKDRYRQGEDTMGFVTTDDGVQIFYKDWGPRDAQPIVFHHGWPLSSDDWDAQMLFFLSKGYRVVAHDRRGHGRSSQVAEGHDIDHYAADAFAVAEALDLRNAVHIGHSTGGGEVARYVARHGEPAGRVAKAVLVAAIPPLMLKTHDNPEGTPMEVFDGFRTALAGNRAQFFRDVPSGPFYGFNREGATVQEGVIQNWWRQGMMGSAKAHYDGIKAFSETDQTGDLEAITCRRWCCTARTTSRADRRLGSEGDRAAAGRHAEDLSRPVARHADGERDVLNADLLEFVTS
jgi:non-heme chloroperoxidase